MPASSRTSIDAVTADQETPVTRVNSQVSHACRRSRARVCRRAFAIAVLLAMPLSGARAADSLGAALTGGKVSLDLRYRYEYVNQDKPILIHKTAGSSTLRTALGYTTDSFASFSAMVEFENISIIGAERFDSTVNGKTNQYPVTPTADSSEVNQAYLSYGGFPDTVVQLGRQRIVLDNNRFVSALSFFQNEQTFDAVGVVNKSLPDTQLFYAYLNNANRITGDEAVNGNMHMNTHLFNGSYSGFSAGTLTAYAYLVDIDEQTMLGAASASTKTLGLRFNGTHPLNDNASLLYTAEYAKQSDNADNPQSYDVDYLLGEFGTTLNGITAKLGYEKLGSDGSHSIQVPIGSHHSRDGWDDMFSVTPATGLIDKFLSLTAKPAEIELTLVYRDFSSDTGGVKWGKEWDAMASRTWDKKYTLGVKFADFSSDSVPTYYDTTKAWLWGQVKF